VLFELMTIEKCETETNLVGLMSILINYLTCQYHTQSLTHDCMESIDLCVGALDREASLYSIQRQLVIVFSVVFLTFSIRKSQKSARGFLIYCHGRLN
jgi:hypothetical protein